MFTNFLSAQEPSDSECCKEKNASSELINNGDFSNGQPNISSSDYTQVAVNQNQLLGGEYQIRRPVGVGTRAFMACTQWNIQDQDHCDNFDAGAYMIVNGLTSNNGWKNAITIAKQLDQGTYNFCIDLKNLRNCCINFMQPQIEIEIDLNGNSVASDIFYLNENTSQACDWLNKALNFTINTSGTLQIKVNHNANFRIDGNDFAVDNISLTPINKIPTSDLYFNTETSQLGNGNYEVFVDPINPSIVGDGCTSIWEIYKFDHNSQTWNLEKSITGFSSYPQKLNYTFSNDFEYKITWVVNCPCSLESSWSFQLGPEALIKLVDSLAKATYTAHHQLIGTSLEPIYNKHLEFLKKNTGRYQVESFELYPNPTTGEVDIQISNGYTGIINYSIFTLSGKKMDQGEFRKEDFQKIYKLDLTNLNSGSFIIKLNYNDSDQVRKLIVN